MRGFGWGALWLNAGAKTALGRLGSVPWVRWAAGSQNKKGDRIGLWPFAGCTVYDPAYALEKMGKAYVCARRSGYDESPYTHTIGEHLQLVDHLRGAFEIPEDLRPFCNVDFKVRPGGFEAAVRDLDVAIVEECSDVEIVLRGVVLNRNRLTSAIQPPAGEAGQPVAEIRQWAAAAHSWYYDGLLRTSPRREEYAARLLAVMPGRGEQDALLREIIRGAEPRRIGATALVDGVHRLQALLRKPVGVLTHTQNYKADGSPIIWPRRLHDQILKACRDNGIPAMHPGELVERHGTGIALQDDLSHWRDDFLPTVAEAIASFVAEMVGRSGRFSETPAVMIAPQGTGAVSPRDA